MLTGLRVSSLVCKCMLYRPEHNTTGGRHGIEFLKSFERNQRKTIIQILLIHTNIRFMVKPYMGDIRVTYEYIRVT